MGLLEVPYADMSAVLHLAGYCLEQMAEHGPDAELLRNGAYSQGEV